VASQIYKQCNPQTQKIQSDWATFRFMIRVHW